MKKLLFIYIVGTATINGMNTPTYKLSQQDKNILACRMFLNHEAILDMAGSFYKKNSFPQYNQENNQLAVLGYGPQGTTGLKIRSQAVPLKHSPTYAPLPKQFPISECGIFSFMHNGDQIAAAGINDNNIYIWNPQTGKAIHHIETKSSVLKLAYHPSQFQLAAIVTSAGLTKLISWTTAPEQAAQKLQTVPLIEQNSENALGMNYNSDGTQLAVTLTGRMFTGIILYNFIAKNLEKKIKMIKTDLVNGGFNSIAYSPDNSMIATLPSPLTIYDTNSCERIAIINLDNINYDYFSSLSFDTSGKTLACLSGLQPATSLDCWNMAQARRLHDLINSKLDYETYLALFTFARDQKLTLKQRNLLVNLGFHVPSTKHERACCTIS